MRLSRFLSKIIKKNKTNFKLRVYIFYILMYDKRPLKLVWPLLFTRKLVLTPTGMRMHKSLLENRKTPALMQKVLLLP